MQIVSCYVSIFFLGMTKKEKIFIANREKEKGNEAFGIGDYVEAVTYYTR